MIRVDCAGKFFLFFLPDSGVVWGVVSRSNGFIKSVGGFGLSADMVVCYG